MVKMRKILQPQYVGYFKCIGSACEDSCCIGWRVDIDKETYQKYRQCTNEQLRLQMNVAVKRNRTNALQGNYAKIKHDTKGACPFIDEDKLCTIQRKLGEEYLSIACTVYPRITNIINNIMERSLSMSCPEATRRALLNPKLMEFDEMVEDTAVRFNPGLELNTSDFTSTQRPEKYFWELRFFIISLLQDRSYKLWQRLVILGLFCKNLTKLVGDCAVQEIPKLITTYMNYLEQNSFRAELDSIPTELTIQMSLMKALADQSFLTNINNQRFLKCFEEFLQGIQCTEEAKKEEMTVQYSQAHNKYYQPFMQQHEYILENYIINYVFMKLFPFNGEKHVFDSFILLTVHYAMIKMFLIGMAGYHKEDFSTVHVIKLIQSFGRVIEHNDILVKHIFNLLKSNDMNTLAYMAILIKN